MLLRFETDNYKNFADGFELSMEPKQAQKDLTYSLLAAEVGDRTYGALSSGVIFGPNAAGKSSIINAVDTFKQIVLRGHVRNAADQDGCSRANVAGGLLELIPNRFLQKDKPISFAIEFVTKGIHFRYGFSAEIGSFLDFHYPRRVLAESLDVNQKSVFVYKNGEYAFGSIEDIPDDIWGDNMSDRKGRAELAGKMAQMARPTDLFLMNGFRTSLSPKIAQTIREWLSEKLLVLCGSQATMFLPETKNCEDGGFQKDDFLSEIVSTISPNTDAAGYVLSKNRPVSLEVELSDDGMAPRRLRLPAEYYESHGIIRFLSIFPGIMNALTNGQTLIMDDFDASMHPFLAQEIIAMFHNDELNKNNAQLIVSTHNVVHMSGALYRRDEIHLADTDREKHSSEHYTLAEFETQGENGVRNDEAYMRKYLREAYGACPDFDLDNLTEFFFERRRQALSATNPASAAMSADVEQSRL